MGLTGRPYRDALAGSDEKRTDRGSARPPAEQPAGQRECNYLPQLHHSGLVARGVAEPRVDPVGLLVRLLLELDTTALELLVGGLDVVGGEEEAAGGTLRNERLELLTRFFVKHRWAR